MEELDLIITKYAEYPGLNDIKVTPETYSMEYGKLSRRIRLEKIDESDCRVTYYLQNYAQVVYIVCSILFIWTIIAPTVMMSYYIYSSVFVPKQVMGMIEEHLMVEYS
jgi:hypothetical protein